MLILLVLLGLGGAPASWWPSMVLMLIIACYGGGICNVIPKGCYRLVKYQEEKAHPFGYYHSGTSSSR